MHVVQVSVVGRRTRVSAGREWGQLLVMLPLPEPCKLPPTSRSAHVLKDGVEPFTCTSELSRGIDMSGELSVAGWKSVCWVLRVWTWESVTAGVRARE